ncbi:hypothetical protein LVD15_10605 [Fulvivirga maritima]|uniref:hypothetical protein n=1 Tax=Fulvivirga maritima TaxID=2904247 RepID=UPI001F2A4BAC|nr:hypothetical protein [Fulvivirga maritima]UII28850.1 hypothetical protein LVD15_10605 [Fulvivirga maritima]
MIEITKEKIASLSPQYEGDDILKFIPQRKPFVMVSSFYQYDDNSVLSGFDIEENNPLVKSGIFTEAGLTENMAQTAALFAGSTAQAQGAAAPVGFIASIKDLQIVKRPKVGQHIYTTIEIVNEVMNVQIARAHVFDENLETWAKSEIRIFLQSTES